MTSFPDLLEYCLRWGASRADPRLGFVCKWFIKEELPGETSKNKKTARQGRGGSPTRVWSQAFGAHNSSGSQGMLWSVNPTLRHENTSHSLANGPEVEVQGDKLPITLGFLLVRESWLQEPKDSCLKKKKNWRQLCTGKCLTTGWELGEKALICSHYPFPWCKILPPWPMSNYWFDVTEHGGLGRNAQ